MTTPLKQINQLAAENGSTLVIFYIPFSTIINDYPICLYSASTCAKLRKSDDLGNALESWAQLNHIHFIDPVNEFRSLEQSGEKLYYSYDGHWTEKDTQPPEG